METMYAIIESGGKQFWVVPGETIQVEKISAPEGQELSFAALWAVGDTLEGQEPPVSRTAQVTAEIKGQLRGPKILVFKKRTKKAYKKMQGHRQNLTDIIIKSITLNNDSSTPESPHSVVGVS
jgi:large subunit ribosomal protein L21